MANAQNFSIINTIVKTYSEKKLCEPSRGFIHFFLDYLNPDLGYDELDDCITDNSGDGGIDAIFIDESSSTDIYVNIYNSKYTENAENALNKEFPSNETDKVVRNWNSMYQRKDMSGFDNPVVKDKMSEIFSIISNSDKTVHCKLYLISNMQKLRDSHLDRLKIDITGIDVECIDLACLAKIVLDKNKKLVSGTVPLEKGKYFEEAKNGNSVRAIIVRLNAYDVVKLVSSNPKLNISPTDFPDNIELVTYLEDINKSVFDDNVRNYIEDSKSRINKSISVSALSEIENTNFFYYNNGINIICENFDYNPNFSSPTLKITNFQIVNGQQTVQTLFNAFKCIPFNKNILEVKVLVKIYATSDPNLRYNISEYTNSQNAVTVRDLRSNDEVQKKLQIELKAKGYDYERQPREFKYQHRNSDIISSEKVGQILQSFYHEKPAEAKNKKANIFTTDYKKIFNPEVICADYALLPYLIHQKIERESKLKEKLLENMEPELRRIESFIGHSTFYIIYLLRKITNEAEGSLENKVNSYLSNYERAIEYIKSIVIQEIKEKPNYKHADLFKNSNLKTELDKLYYKTGGIALQNPIF